MEKDVFLSFKPDSNWECEDQFLFQRGALVELPANSAVCFVGCNGAGKSTLLDQIRGKLLRKLGYRDIKEEQNPFVRIFSKGDDPKATGYCLLFNAGFEVARTEEEGLFSSFFFSSQSTGEALSSRLGQAANLLGRYAAKAKEEGVPLAILWDDCDAGTSIDAQDDIVAFFKLVMEQCEKDGVRYCLVVSANSYELARSFPCFDVASLKPVSFASYEEYKRYVLASRKRKGKREERSAKARAKKSGE